jgi:hypothetical protein
VSPGEGEVAPLPGPLPEGAELSLYEGLPEKGGFVKKGLPGAELSLYEGC